MSLFINRRTYALIFALLLTHHLEIFASDTLLPPTWSKLIPVLRARLLQKKPKMKLHPQQIDILVGFLNNPLLKIPRLRALQDILPKTTVELLRATAQRDLARNEAEKIAFYLQEWVLHLKLSNQAAFDENTSHIIGREWSEIDYTGENTTWRNQRKKYFPYGVLHFKSLLCLKKFFAVESQLPYFKKIYHPQNLPLPCKNCRPITLSRQENSTPP